MFVTSDVPFYGATHTAVAQRRDLRLMECWNMARLTTYLILVLLIAGCTTNQPNETDKVLDIAKIRIDTTSKRSDGSVEMITRCSGFLLSEKEVRAFLENASRIKDEGADKYYRILPCSATGTAVINKIKYDWVIRAGGIGEFTSGTDRFITICGKKCCNKVPGVC